VPSPKFCAERERRGDRPVSLLVVGWDEEVPAPSLLLPIIVIIVSSKIY